MHRKKIAVLFFILAFVFSFYTIWDAEKINAESETYVSVSEITQLGAGYENSLSITFDAQLPLRYFEGQNPSFVDDFITVGGKTVEEFENENELTFVIHQMNNGWFIYTEKAGFSFADGTVIEMKKGIGFMTAEGIQLEGYELIDDYMFTRDGLYWIMETETDTEQISTLIENVNNFGSDYKDLLCFNLDFDLQGYLNGNALSFIRNFIEIDGVPLSELINSENIALYINQQAGGRIDFWFKKNGAPYLFNEGTIIVIKQGMGFFSGTGGKQPKYYLDSDYVFVLNNSIWTMTKIVEEFSLSEIFPVTVKDSLCSLKISFSTLIAPFYMDNNALMPLIGDYIKFNRKSLNSINQTTSNSVTANASGNMLNIIISKNLFSFNNSDCLEINKDMQLNGKILETDYVKYYNDTISEWTNYNTPVQINERSVNVSNISLFSNTASGTVFSINFTDSIADYFMGMYNAPLEWHQTGVSQAVGITEEDVLKMEVQSLWQALQDGIVITYYPVGSETSITKTIGQISAYAVENEYNSVSAFIANYGTNSITFTWNSEAALIMIDYSKEVKLKIISSVWVSPVGAVLDEDYEKVYYDSYSGWYDEGYTPEYSETKADKAELLMLQGGFWSMQIFLRSSATVNDVHMLSVQNRNLTDNILFNGKSLSWIIENAKDSEGMPVVNPVYLHLLPSVYEGEQSTGPTIFHLMIKDTVAAEYGGIITGENNLPLHDANSLELLSSLKTPSLKTLNKNYVFRYRDSWFEIINTDNVAWDDIKLVNISAPYVFLDGTVYFNLIFDKDVTAKSFAHVNADPAWLLGASSFEDALFHYTVSEVNMLLNYRIFDSITNKILFNGKTIAELMKKEPDTEWQNLTISVHLGYDSNYKQIQIGFSASSASAANKITDLNYPFEFKILKGFKTSSQCQTTQDYTFVYKPDANYFNSVTNENVSNSEIRSILYNGKIIEKNGILTLEKGTFNSKIFTVICAESTGYVINGIDNLKEGDNTVSIVSTSFDGTTSSSFDFVLNITGNNETGCSSVLSEEDIVFMSLPILLISMFTIIRRR